jgi:hypothetical protein
VCKFCKTVKERESEYRIAQERVVGVRDKIIRRRLGALLTLVITLEPPALFLFSIVAIKRTLTTRQNTFNRGAID